MELRHFRYFLAVADEASFVRAAARLHLSQPPLSLQIRDLEEELGVKLFDRSNRGVTLTAAGEAFYPEAQAVMARVARARDTARHAGCGEIGRLTAGFVSIADYSLLPEALQIFRQRYPKVELVLREETADVQTRLLLDAEIDVGLALAPIDDGRIEFESLLVERLLLAVPSAFVQSRSVGLRAGGSRSRPSLARHANDAFILPPRVLAPGLHDSVLGYCRSAGFVPRIAQYAKQMQTVVSLVSAGLGVALVPESLRHLQRTGVTYLTPREPSPQVELGLIRRRDDDSVLQQRFAEAAREAAVAYRQRERAARRSGKLRA